MSRTFACLLLTAVVLPAAGCATVATGRFGNPSGFADTSPGKLEQVALRTLMELRFNIVLPQARPGLIETEPLTGSSWFEFWRKDTIGRVQVAESSLHTIRRRATVSVSAQDGGSQVAVRVIKERLCAPGSTPGSLGASFNSYETEDTELMRRDALAETEYQWVEMGRDELLEQYILERIHANLGR